MTVLVVPLADPPDVEDPKTGAHDVERNLDGSEGTGHQRAGHQLDAGGHPLVDRGRIMRRPLGGIGFEVEEHGEERRTGHAVHRRVVHLGDEGDAATEHALDHPDLPQWLAAVELLAGDVAGQVAELA